MKREKIRKQFEVGIVRLVAIGLVVAAAMYAVPRLEGKLFPRKANEYTRRNIIEDAEPADMYIGGEWYRKKPDLSTVLVMGVDNREGLVSSGAYNNEGQADFLMLLATDKKTGDGFVVHVNRDTVTNIPVLSVNGRQIGRTNAQIALAYNYGDGGRRSCENVLDAVQYLLYGIEIDHYVALSMAGVALLNDGVGGVEVTIEDDFSQVDPTLVMNQTVLLEGEHALNFVRARGGMADSSNLKRMERQRQYVDGWLRQAQKLDQKQMLKLEYSVIDEVITDCTQAQFQELIDGLTKGSIRGIYPLPGEAKQGKEFMEYHLDEVGTQALMLELFYDRVTDEHQ